jgi:hypothetical protein
MDVKNRRVLFSVIEVTDGVGSSHMEIDWHHDLYPILEVISPNGKMTDRVIDIAEEILSENEAEFDDK